MKKILLTLLALSSISAFAVGSTQSALTVNATVGGSCTSTLGGSTNNSLNFGTFNSQILEVQQSVQYLLTCTANFPITSINVTSINAWKLKNGADFIPYTLAAPVVSSDTVTGYISNWSLIAGEQNVIPQGYTFNGDGTAMNLNITATVLGSSIGADDNAGDYADTVNIVTNF